MIHRRVFGDGFHGKNSVWFIQDKLETWMIRTPGKVDPNNHFPQKTETAGRQLAALLLYQKPMSQNPSIIFLYSSTSQKKQNPGRINTKGNLSFSLFDLRIIVKNKNKNYIKIVKYINTMIL